MTRKALFFPVSCHRCQLCKRNGRTEFYIGESTRTVRYRFKEHQSAARLRRPDTLLGNHIAYSHFDASGADINSGFSLK